MSTLSQEVWRSHRLYLLRWEFLSELYQSVQTRLSRCGHKKDETATRTQRTDGIRTTTKMLKDLMVYTNMASDDPIRNIMTLVDEHRDSLPDGVYLELCDNIKRLYALGGET